MSTAPPQYGAVLKAPWTAEGVLCLFSVLYSKKVNKVFIDDDVPKRSTKNALEAPCCSLGTGGALPTRRI